MAPNQVTEQNKFTVWGRLFGHVINIDPPKFKVGDKVRVLHFDPKRHGKEYADYYKKTHSKKMSKITGKPIREHILGARDKPPFSDEIFLIDKVLIGDPIVYELYSPEENIEIWGKFYEAELNLVKD